MSSTIKTADAIEAVYSLYRQAIADNDLDHESEAEAAYRRGREHGLREALRLVADLRDRRA